ncbi:MAG: sugar ABC transporter ATP-binding protein [Solirubrobacteraceae bacterium]
MTPGEQLLQVRGASKRYPGVLALDGVDVDLRAGEVLGLLGKNGAGKSTLIKILAGAVQPNDGEIRLDGKPVSIDSPQHATELGIAVVHQELADVPNLSVAENIELGLGYPRRLGVFVDQRGLRRKTLKILERLGVRANPATLVEHLSIAERRMVMIARGLAANARILVLDEPTASLSDEEIDHLHTTIGSLAADGVAVVYVTHRLAEVFKITDRITVMLGGRTVFDSPTSAVTSRQLIDQITGGLGEAGITEERIAPVVDPDAEEILRTEGLSREGHVEDANLSLRRGEILGIAGLVGAGRTELVRLMFGADRATSGRVFVNGSEVRLRTPRDGMRAGIALLPEDRRHQGNVQAFSIRQNITLPGLKRFRGVGAVPMPSTSQERAAAHDLVERLQIKVASVEDPVSTLSGGNQQKVVLAKWLDSGSDVFIFDEPTHGIDVGGKEEVYRRMRELAAAGKGVIFISSEFSELIGICNRIVVMREGRLVAELEGEGLDEGALVEACYEH